jgi:hypothetical protein
MCEVPAKMRCAFAPSSLLAETGRTSSIVQTER